MLTYSALKSLAPNDTLLGLLVLREELSSAQIIHPYLHRTAPYPSTVRRSHLDLVNIQSKIEIF